MSAADWFTTARDRAETRGRINLARTTSPAAIAAAVPARFAVRAPITTLALTEAEQRAWAETLHGGWCDAHTNVLGVAFEAAATDVTNCPPLVAHLCDWWTFLTTAGVKRRTVTTALRRLCARATLDPTVVCRPDVWLSFGFTLVEVVPDSERFPIEVEDEHRPDGRFEVVPVRSPRRPLYYAWPDVVAAAVLSGRVPRIVRAVRLEPTGRQPHLRKHLPLLPGVVLDVDSDPVFALARARRHAKDRGDVTLAAELHAVTNSLVFGNFWRFDPIRRKADGRWVDDECPGPGNCVPIAATISAGAHLVLAVLEKLVSDRASLVAYRDTDSSIVPATATGGTLTLPNGTTTHMLSWQELDDILAVFAPLSPEPDWAVWKTERTVNDSPLQALVFGPKRHVEFIEHDGRIQIVDCTETELGGTCVDPPHMRGRGPDGRRRWSAAAIEREIAFALARQRGDDALRAAAPWNNTRESPFPDVRRRIVKTPEMAARLPTQLGARLGTRYVEGAVEKGLRTRQPTPVALDPGGDLSN
jgi:hypothetical protein